MEAKLLKFDKNYSKLDSPVFATLRLNPPNKSKYVKNKEYMVKSPGQTFVAECIMILEGQLRNLGDDFLMADTDTESRQEAIEELRRYYPELKKDTLMTCYWFEKL